MINFQIKWLLEFNLWNFFLFLLTICKFGQHHCITLISHQKMKICNQDYWHWEINLQLLVRFKRMDIYWLPPLDYVQPWPAVICSIISIYYFLALHRSSCTYLSVKFIFRSLKFASFQVSAFIRRTLNQPAQGCSKNKTLHDDGNVKKCLQHILRNPDISIYCKKYLFLLELPAILRMETFKLKLLRRDSCSIIVNTAPNIARREVLICQ